MFQDLLSYSFVPYGELLRNFGDLWLTLSHHKQWYFFAWFEGYWWRANIGNSLWGIHSLLQNLVNSVGKWFVKPCSRTILMLKFEWHPMCKNNGSWWICVIRREEIEIVYSYTQNNYWVNEKLIPKVCLLKWKK